MAEYLKQAPMYSKASTQEIEATVASMLDAIERDGDTAIRDFSERLDGWSPEDFRVSADLIEAAFEQVGPQLRAHIDAARENIEQFARAQRETMTDLEVQLRPGVVLGHRHIPIGAVGSYVPGGRYPLIASALMTISVPKIAGVRRVVACAPPQRDGNGVHPAMLYAMASAGADEIYALGGVQAMAAMALGFEQLRPVDMIVGAGNAYVAEAKRRLFGHVGIDLLAGPTEILVIADESADPELVAADLLGQAEHGPNSPAILITTSRDLGERAIEAVADLLASWPTAEVAGAAWEAHGSVAVVAGHREAMELSDTYAPEHLEVQVDPGLLDDYLQGLRNYGSLFLGEQATVVYGDKAVGTNHVLPTMGAARYTGGLWVGKFLKTCTYQRLTDQGTQTIAPVAAAVATAEGMAGHALTATMRLDRLASHA
jgi:sulfopropanediol 3-dehydrogenase